MSRFMGHYQAGQICAVFLRGDRQDYEEVCLLNALEGCCAYLIIGSNDPRRNQSLDGVPYYTAVERATVPHHIKQSDKRWLQVYDRATGEPLNGGALRDHKAAIQRASFDTPHDEYEAAE